MWNSIRPTTKNEISSTKCPFYIRFRDSCVFQRAIALPASRVGLFSTQVFVFEIFVGVLWIFAVIAVAMYEDTESAPLLAAGINKLSKKETEVLPKPNYSAVATLDTTVSWNSSLNFQ